MPETKIILKPEYTIFSYKYVAIVKLNLVTIRLITKIINKVKLL
jgi:hypothetical protein